ncbi:MAG: hypothetical protein KBG28_00600 [Kofleriaceae bacterium]|nr:hypothetical protein [Kofleriaceae bacterium]
MRRVHLPLLLPLTAALVACGPDDEVTCGDGTVLRDGQCVVATPDAGAPAAELPVSAILQPTMLRVLEGFAACPALTLAYADGTVRRVSLDPAYTLPDVSTITELGLAVSWESADGLVSTGTSHGCAYAAVGVRAGTTLVSIRITAASGESRVVGQAQAEVVTLPASVRVSGVVVRSDLLAEGVMSDAYWNPAATTFASGQPVLGPGQVASVQPTFVLDDPSLAGVSALPIEENLQVEVSNPSVAAYAGGALTALTPGQVSVTGSYRVGARELGAASSAVVVSGSTQLIGLHFGLPRDDAGKVLPEAMRTAQQLPAGQCANFEAYASTRHPVPAGIDDLFLRDVTTTATFEALGAGLVNEGAPHRFCARASGDAAVRVCLDGTCATWGVVVRDLASFPTVTINLPSQVRLRAVAGTQVVCVPFQATAAFAGEASRDVSVSPALHFRQPFGAGEESLQVALDTRTGQAQRQGNDLCVPLRWEQNVATPWVLGVGYGQGQAQATINVLPPLQ